MSPQKRMKPTPSALKWMAEKRARVAFDLDFNLQLIADLQAKAAALQEDLAAIDRSIGLYDETIDPGAIEPVNGWRGNYGKRGALKAAVVEVLEAHAPNWVSTDAIESAIRAKFGLVFETPVVRKHWYNGSFTLSEEQFQLDVTGWTDASQEVAPDRIEGAIAYVRGMPQLLSRSSWAVLGAVQSFNKRPQEQRTQHEQELAWGRIRKLADEAGAMYLSPYLDTTYVLTPETLRLPLRKEETPFGRVYTVEPTFESAPGGWLAAFDGYNSVQPHYEFTRGGGRVRVVISEPVRQVLSVIKREMPGRKVAGSRAQKFIHNPWAFLGEAAHEVLDADVIRGWIRERFSVPDDKALGIAVWYFLKGLEDRGILHRKFRQEFIVLVSDLLGALKVAQDKKSGESRPLAWVKAEEAWPSREKSQAVAEAFAAAFGTASGWDRIAGLLPAVCNRETPEGAVQHYSHAGSRGLTPALVRRYLVAVGFVEQPPGFTRDGPARRCCRGAARKL